MPSFDFRLVIRVLGRFSVPSLGTDLASLLGASDGVVMAWVSSLGGLGAFEEECLRWWTCADAGSGEPVNRAWDDLEMVEHDTHVHVLRRMNSLE